jgi:hypothetical protein
MIYEPYCNNCSQTDSVPYPAKLFIRFFGVNLTKMVLIFLARGLAESYLGF